MKHPTPPPTSTHQPAQFSPNDVSTALNTQLVTTRWGDSITQPNNSPFTQITTDSRVAQKGALFIAIVGETHDGHQFIQSAIDQGATGALVSKKYWKEHAVNYDKATNTTFWIVDETLEAFRTLAAVYRKRFKIPVIVVAGSVGKTTTKELLFSCLSGKWPGKVLKTRASQNGFLGIPMTLFSLTAEHEAAVIEVGIDEPGTMKQHLLTVNPTHAVLTTIGPEHLEKLLTIETVAREEFLALSITALSGGVIAVNLSDPYIAPKLHLLPKSNRLTYQFSPDTENQSTFAELVASGQKQTISFKWLNSETAPFSLNCPLPGDHNSLNLTAAVAVSLQLGLTPLEIKAGLETFQNVGGRSEINDMSQAGKPKVRFFCDYYNANPSSMIASFKMAKNNQKSPQIGQFILCLGDMLELGQDEIKFHEELAEPIETLSPKLVLLYGERMKALQAKLNQKVPSRHFESHAELAAALLASLSENDNVIIKGSRGMKMETIWQKCREWYGLEK